MNAFASSQCARRMLMALAAISGFFLMAGCGSSSPSKNQEGYNNGSFNGTYVFSFSGTDITSGSASFFAVAGMMAADGQGHITSATIDLNDPSLAQALGLTSALFRAESATGGYTVTSDGRASGSLSVSIGGTTAVVPIGIDFVLSSTSHGLITRFDGNGSGSGTLDLETSGITQSELQGSYAFGFSGVAAVSGDPFASAGAFTLDVSGNASGLTDLNSDGTSPGGLTGGLPLLGGSNLLVGSPVSTATLNTSEGSFTFDVYIVDATHLKFIETDTTAITVGDAFTQQTSIPQGVYAYTMEGEDSSGNPLAMGGFLTSNGTSAINSGYQDYNDAGTVNSVTGITGSFTAFTGGRTQLTLNGLYNGETLASPVVFAAYPSSGGIQLLEVDNAGITSGAALAQGSVTGIATSQGYGLNLSAFNAQGYEEDDIAQFEASSSTNFTGVIDINDVGVGQTFGAGFGGTYAADPNITGHGSLSSNQFNANYYMANGGSTVLMMETDNIQVGVGSFEAQTSQSASAPAAARAHFAAVRPRASKGAVKGKSVLKGITSK